MGAEGDKGVHGRFLHFGILLAVSLGNVGTIWYFRNVNGILVAFSVAWVLVVTAFAWEMLTRAERLDDIVGSRTDVLEEANRQLTSVLEQLRAFHRISYEMNQRIELGEIAGAFAERLHRDLPQVDSVWLWLDRAVLRVDTVDDGDAPRAPQSGRTLDLAGQAGDDLSAPDELVHVTTDNPLVRGCFRGRGITLVRNLRQRARMEGWRWLAGSSMQSAACFALSLGGNTLGVLGILSRRSLSAEFIRQLHLSVNQLTVALDKARLLGQMQRRAEELAAANDELRQLDAMKNWFVSAVSHELRTPLTNIRSFGEILETYEDLDTAERREFAGIIREESERLSAMITNLLDLAKIANGEVDLNPAPMDVGALVQRCCKLFSQEAEERGMELACSVADEVPHAYADESAVARVMNNLLGNAFKFTADGGRIEVAVEGPGPAPPGARFVTVLVSDSGRGIAVGDQQRIFEKFTQVGDPLTDKPAGTGIGLAISREIVELSHGDIWVQSALGQGSTFGFTLPEATFVEEVEAEAARPTAV